jgi:hypothetical protein
MRVVLKPAGLLVVMGMVTALATVIYAKSQRARISQLPTTAPIEGFKSKKAAGPKGVFDSTDKMAPVNLSEVGKADWVYWGMGGNKAVVRKAGGSKEIGTFELIQPKAGLLSKGEKGRSRAFLWSDGAPVKSTPVTYAGVHVKAGNGFRLSVPAEKGDDRTLYVFVGGWKAGGQFSAWVTDGTTPEVKKEDIALDSGYYSRVYAVRYHASTPDQQLKVTWRLDSGEGNISLQAVALQ